MDIHTQHSKTTILLYCSFVLYCYLFLSYWVFFYTNNFAGLHLPHSMTQPGTHTVYSSCYSSSVTVNRVKKSVCVSPWCHLAL